MITDYHGKTPVTAPDIKMAKKHLQTTQKLVLSKIADHETAKEDAQEAGNKPSADYNQAHLQDHKQENAKINKSLSTVKRLKPKSMSSAMASVYDS